MEAVVNPTAPPNRRRVNMTVGPIQGLVIGFPDNEMFEGRIAEELARLSDVGQIRVIDAVFVTRDGDEIDVLSLSGLDDEQRAELRAAVGALVGLGLAGEEGAIAGAEAGASVDVDALTIAESVAADLIEDLPDGSSALVLAFEHLWAVPLREAVRDAGGIVLAHRSLSAEDLIRLGMLMGYAAELEAEQEAIATSTES
jgi:uncharacterized membrane protein